MSITLTNIASYANKVVTVMGLGRYKQGSGLGAAKWLLRHGAQLVITDLKSQAELKESVDDLMHWYDTYRKQFPDRTIYQPVFVLGEHREENFTDVDLVMQNPGVPRESKFVALAKSKNIPVESDISLFYRLCPFPIIGITGTRGKSTTTTLLGEICKQQHPKTVIAGNITRSPLEDLDWLLEEKKPVPIVLELSSWLLESLQDVPRGADIGILTNVYEDHLDRYPSFEAYREAKELLFKHQKRGQVAIINADNPVSRDVATRVPSTLLWYSLKPLPEKANGIFLDGDDCYIQHNGAKDKLCSLSAMKLQGNHNKANALAAILAAYMCRIPVAAIEKTLATFGGLPSRQEYIRTWNAIDFVNDTTATSPEGVMVALERYNEENRRIILICGGVSKGFSYTAMAQMISKTCAGVVYLDGTASTILKGLVEKSIPDVVVSSMKEAVTEAVKLAKPNDVVLLSPGAASFNLFKNEFDRGNQFVECVKQLT